MCHWNLQEFDSVKRNYELAVGSHISLNFSSWNKADLWAELVANFWADCELANSRHFSQRNYRYSRKWNRHNARHRNLFYRKNSQAGKIQFNDRDFHSKTCHCAFFGFHKSGANHKVNFFEWNKPIWWFNLDFEGSIYRSFHHKFGVFVGGTTLDCIICSLVDTQ